MNGKNLGLNHVIRVLICLFVVMIGTMTIFQTSMLGFLNIMFEKDILITDYIEVGGISSALMNAIMVTSLGIYFLKKFDVTIDGYAYAGIFTTLGFAFFGKNAYNVLAIYFGVYLYARALGRPFGEFVVKAMFACGLAPFTTIWFDLGFWGITGGLALGTFLGFIVCSVAVYSAKFHHGLLLYNFGYAGGILAIIVTSILRTFDFEIEPVMIVSTSREIHFLLVALIALISAYFLLVGLVGKKKSGGTYSELLVASERVTADYYEMFDQHLMFINMGLVGFLQLFFALYLKVPFNGPIFGAILSGIGFAAMGKNPYNITPVMLGSMLMMYITSTDITPGIVLTVLFATGLAPLTSEFGPLVGFIAGMLHFSLTQYTATWQGGNNLYNNGFSAGFIAGVVASVMEYFEVMWNVHKGLEIKKDE